MEKLDPEEIFELLEACDELCFNELIDDLQNYLIKEWRKEWIQQNINYFYINILSKSQSFNLLQVYFEKLINGAPEIFLKSEDISLMEKSLLISLLIGDDLVLNEIDIWNYVIKWRVGQIENLDEKNILQWNG